MHGEEPGFIDFRDLPDEAVIALSEFLELKEAAARIAFTPKQAS
ncbi:MAG: hypothetical protein M0Z44_06565 [Gammaproteobacteria bacterium]|nr:hypothetical protein [Gammaproteobacteria bacterium]